MDLLGFLTKRQQSKNIAKDRLKLVLIHDRADTNPGVLEMLKNDIIQVIAKYMDIENEELDIQITQTSTEENKRVPMLMANIPIKNMKK